MIIIRYKIFWIVIYIIKIQEKSVFKNESWINLYLYKIEVYYLY